MIAESGRPLRTAWIIGAGFSRSLGGPLLDQLLRFEALEDLALLYPRHDSAQNPPLGYPADLAKDIYTAKALYRFGRDVERVWRDPEEYIQFLDECASDPETASGQQARKIALRWSKSGKDGGFESYDKCMPAALATSAKRALAADCSRFTRTAVLGSERWSPYRSWLARLAAEQANHKMGHQVLISFNYDRVLELASDGACSIVLGGNQPLTPTQVPLFKMHGSVDWVIDASGACILGQPEQALICDPLCIAMGVPGRSKQTFTQKVGGLWRAGIEFIKKAEVVIFVGYRFPETDAQAREQILTALAQNKEMHISVHIVRGPDTEDRDGRRIKSLLENSLRGERTRGARTDSNSRGNTYSLLVHPLFAEDFLCLHAQVGRFNQERSWMFA